MTKYLIAFRPEVSTSVVTDLIDHYADYQTIFSGEYGLTILCDICEEALELFDWALSMTCNLEQRGIKNE